MSSARLRYAEFLEDGGVTPCQLMPSSAFMHRIRPHMPLDEINDSLAAADACAACPVRGICEEMGRDEPFGVWGGISRSDRTFRRNLIEDDMPAS